MSQNQESKANQILKKIIPKENILNYFNNKLKKKNYLMNTYFNGLCVFQVVFNDWSGESGDLNGSKIDASDQSGSNPLSLSVPVCYMRNPHPRSPTRSIRTVHMRYNLIESQQFLVHNN